jgi:hypothetical protein
MFESRSLATAGQFIRSFGGQVAMSVAVSTCVAGVWAVPQLLFPRDGAAPVAIVQADRTAQAAWMAPGAVDGKIADRHRAAIETDLEAPHRNGGLMMPAALAMPMSTGWPQPVFAEPVRLVEATVEKAVRSGMAETASVRRSVTVAMAERPKVASPAAPMAIAPPASAGIPSRAEPDSAEPEPTLLGRVVYEPVARAGGLVSSAAGAVGSAGTWTVTQATSLLPRW